MLSSPRRPIPASPIPTIDRILRMEDVLGVTEFIVQPDESPIVVSVDSKIRRFVDDSVSCVPDDGDETKASWLVQAVIEEVLGSSCTSRATTTGSSYD